MKRDNRLNSYLRTLVKESPAVAKLYPQDVVMTDDSDSLNENHFEVVSGLVHKFTASVLWLINGVCAAQCSFCERLPKGVGDSSQYRSLQVSEADVSEAISYIESHKEITDVIFSGGDPLTSLGRLPMIVAQLSTISHVKTVRIHTKLPLQNPRVIGSKQLDILQSIVDALEDNGKVAYFSINASHPDEFTDEARRIIKKIRQMGYVMIAQSVFLKGVNGDADTLVEMFSELAGMGIKPYYLYHCQSKPHTHALGFVEELSTEIKIVKEVIERLPGIARPSHVIDIEGKQWVGNESFPKGFARGKVVIPHHFNGKNFFDLDGRDFSLQDYV